MNTENQVLGLTRLSQYIKDFLNKNQEDYNDNDSDFELLLKRSEIENPWFTIENQKFALKQWTDLLTEENIADWLKEYQISKTTKRVGLILAGNIPLVGFHDVISVVLSNHIPVIKLSSKDKYMIPFLLKKWNEFSEGNVSFEFVERLENFDAVIATGSNNTARYLEYYFKNHLNIIRKNRTSIAVLKGDETEEELKLLAEDIFRYFGLGCRNVTRLFIPQDFVIDRLFESFLDFQEIINHNKYANNYDYNRAVYLLNQDKFWDNNFVMLKEDEKLFSPLSVINFSRYSSLDEVKSFISENEENIQCVVAKDELGLDSIKLGEAQNPGLNTYADNVDTMKFLSVI
ncbi:MULTISPECIES: acyl-CoA reductase [Chryseobacterium]|uniref:Acyl-CoA reductase n=1 Tax=Chryseobacterium gambrini TaxID=373672 RepID=A0ABM8K208_9FLAO|nr:MULTISPECIES: acyl-CoA reductase [unclassified Chryseobacterium]PTT72265.1 acyl-CoA reductase [Chryseobacterium sp. HMWF001]PVV53509.1 acyl-CoA reductase [Chryseobacterium sp. HMWF035]BEV02924.1 acyl-CoA reductase [Chryseobacterium gambrini]